MKAQPTRTQEIRAIWREYTGFYSAFLALIALGVGVWIGATIFADDGGYGINLYTEAISIGVTVIFIEGFNRRRERREAAEKTRQNLLFEMGSVDNARALNAVSRLNAEGWARSGALVNAFLVKADLSTAALEHALMTNATLREATLRDARLTKATLDDANLSQADCTNAQMQAASLNNAKAVKAVFDGANLTGASLRSLNGGGLSGVDTAFRDSDLTGASFGGANLRRANFTRAILDQASFAAEFLHGARLAQASLQHTELRNAKLQKADLRGATLYDANLARAVLAGADLRGAKLRGSVWGNDLLMDEKTTLPDGTRFDPSQAVEQIARFIDPTREDFWEPSG